MARYTKKRIYKKKARYSPNIARIGPSSFNIATESRDIGITTLVENQEYDPNRANSIITVKNVELSIEFDATTSLIESCTAYIMFIPEGYTTTLDTPIQHPEWIMAYKFFGSPNFDVNSTSNTYTDTNKYVNRIRTRLSRRLNTGDRIILLVEGTNTSNQNAYPMQYQGLVRWWTKAN